MTTSPVPARLMSLGGMLRAAPAVGRLGEGFVEGVLIGLAECDLAIAPSRRLRHADLIRDDG